MPLPLTRFDEQLLKPIAAAYGGVMLIDGNDERGIDVGVLIKPGLQIKSICSHVDDADNAGSRIFSRDCAEFTIHNGAGQSVQSEPVATGWDAAILDLRRRCVRPRH